MSNQEYTVNHAIDTLGFGYYQFLLSFIVGMAWVADAMEMMILSVLGPALHCHWQITQVEQASLTTVVFLGMTLSSGFWGILADKFGRKPILIWASSFLCYFGILTAFAPSFHWVLFLRFIVGFFIGSVPQACTLYAEYMPTSIRGRAIMTMQFFWAIGAVFLAVLAWAVMPTLGWRYLLALSTLPLALFLILSPKLLPESLMYLATTGQKDKVEEELKKVAKINKRPDLVGTLILDEQSNQESRGRFLDLFVPGRKRLTLQVWFLWFVGAGTYYGAVLMSTELLNSSEGICLASGESTIDGLPGEEECSAHVCQGLSVNDYVELIWTTFAEFPGTLLAFCLVDWIGRKKTLALLSFLFSISILGVIECAASKTILIILLFCSRGFATGLLQSAYVYTSEVYPTNLRAVALGTSSASARVGAMLTPYIAQVLLKTSLYSAVIVYAVIGLLAAIIAWFLPVETLGLQLNQSGHQVTKGRHQFINEEEEEERTEETCQQNTSNIPGEEGHM